MSRHEDVGKTETVELPLRGLAGEGAEAPIRSAFESIQGVVAVHVSIATFRVRVSYRPAPGVRERIDAALHSLGVA